MDQPTLTPIAAAMEPLSTPVFDIGDYADTTTADVKIKNPATGQPTPIVVTLAGPEHPTRKHIQFARQRRMRAVLAKTGKLPVSDPLEDEEEETELLVASTLGWRGLALNGQVVQYSAAAARQIFSDPKRRWLRDQVRAALDERESFIETSARS